MKLLPIKATTKLSPKGEEFTSEIEYEDEVYKIKKARKSLKYPGKYTCMVSGNQAVLIRQNDKWFVEIK